MCNPGAKDCELKELYDDSFLFELYPGVALSKNTVPEFLKDIGKKCTRIAQFMFRDAATAAKEERDWLARAKKKRDFDDGKFKKRQRTFGAVVLECDKDLAPETVYMAYSKRWEIEVVMKYYKSACEFDETPRIFSPLAPSSSS